MLQILLILSLTAVSFSECRVFLVGGEKSAWKNANLANQSTTLGLWASRNRFQINDALEFKLEDAGDTVLSVSKHAYSNCNVTEPMKTLNKSNSRVKLEKSGPYFFIDGDRKACVAGRRLVLVVMASRGPALPPSPSPAPAAYFAVPAPSPMNSGVQLRGGLLLSAICVFVWAVL